MIAPQERVIFHVDMDSFYASCELARQPEFKSRPFIVGADPKDGKGRGVVLACNYPAREFGVRSGLPISRAWELCPDAKYVYPDHRLYGEVSQRVMSIIRTIAGKLEQVSIDEAYLDVTDDIVRTMSRKSKEDVIRDLVNSIKSSIKKSEKITCSVGVANSKIVAKIATDMHKPDGITLIEPSNVRSFLAPLPVGKIPGVGRVTQKMLEEVFHVRTIGDLAGIPLQDLKERFGKSGIWLKNVSEGIDESEVVTAWEPVSQSSETTFDEDEEDYSTVERIMLEVAKDVHARISRDGYFFRNVGIKIRFSGFETHTRSRMLAAPTQSLDAVNRECTRLLGEFSGLGKKVRLIGVRLSDLEKRPEDQLTLSEFT